MSDNGLIGSICKQNLDVYRVSPIRLREDVAQESEIAHDYRGRILYELLQNADDAMADEAVGAASRTDAVFLQLTDTDLWVGNSGRPLEEDDVRGLCGIGASSKGGAVNRKRASIGHKGMGFKSVLEITDAPEVMSDDFAFKLGWQLAQEPVAALMRELGESAPTRVPAMRFPAPLEEPPREWTEALERGMRVLFRFPLREALGPEQRNSLADRLIDLPVTAILFLKHLEQIDIIVDTTERNDEFRWQIDRTVSRDGAWQPTGGLTETGIYRVEITPNHATSREFFVAHRDDLEIENNRGGLNGYAWHGVELSEVSVAVEMRDGRPVPVEEPARVLHVFLPTAELCPYPLLINAAFSADLSRQEVRVTDDPHDYNSWLLSEAAAVFVEDVAPTLRVLGATDREILSLLDRGASEPLEDAATRTGQVAVDAMRRALAATAYVPTPLGERLTIHAIVVPPLVNDPTAGGMFRALVGDDVRPDGRQFPTIELCGGRPALILADHGALALEAADAPGILGKANLSAVEFELHESELVWVDPVLRTLERLYDGLEYWDRDAFTTAARQAEVFPADGATAGQIVRIAVADRACFYPPRSLSGAIPLDGLCFLSRDVCWGDLGSNQRQELLGHQLALWQAIFGVREFKFPDVMRRSVLPALTLSDHAGRTEEWGALCDPDITAAVCQLAGRTPNAAAPLPYERLKSNRALFNLARLPVPCRGDDPGSLTWEPAYRVYFGEDWIGGASVEAINDVIAEVEGGPPAIPFLASPDLLVPLLERYENLRKVVDDDNSVIEDDEVDLDEDEERALDTDLRERWVSFLTWLGVNHALRPVHFHDVEDRQTGWLTTKNLERPRGSAFINLDANVWSGYVAALRSDAGTQRLAASANLYFYELHDLEFLAEILNSAALDAESRIGKALLGHLVQNWPQLERYAKVEIAAVPFDLKPNLRKPAQAQQDERKLVGDNLWLHRLRRRPFLPTTHGPRLPADAWMPSQEMDRRFSRRFSAGQLLPLLDVDGNLADSAKPFCTRLGVRESITPSNFGFEDARTILTRLARLFDAEDSDDERTVDPADVREVIRPTYRNVIELLRGSVDEGPAQTGVLSDVYMLADNGHGGFRFLPSRDLLWSERNGTRERLGNPADLWTFVMEAGAGLRATLIHVFGMRVLEEQLRWEPEPGEDALDFGELASFRAGLEQLDPFVRLRLSADRPAEESRDATRLRRLTGALTPVRDLQISCRLDDRPLSSIVRQSAFVDTKSDTEVRAFVVWGEHGWPPTADDAEALATALADEFGASNFEAFLMLINAKDDQARWRLLSLSGAPIDPRMLSSATADEIDAIEQPEVQGRFALPKEASDDIPEQVAEKPETPLPVASGSAMVPLYGAAELLIEGTPITLIGNPTGGEVATKATVSHSAEAPKEGRVQGYGGRTDLLALDELGMYVAMTFEVKRLQRCASSASIFDPAFEGDQPDACVFDITTPARITHARKHSRPFDRAMDFLAHYGVSEMRIGCDILTLLPGEPATIDRMIELKSSGQHARTQSMTWNEWKTAQNDEIRSRYFLYLVANLRSDLPDARPFLRAIRDPYGSLRAQEEIGSSTIRRVTLRVDEFEEAEHLELGVEREA